MPSSSAVPSSPGSAASEPAAVAPRATSAKATRRLAVQPEAAAVRERLQRHWRSRAKDAEARRLIRHGVKQIPGCQEHSDADLLLLENAMEFYAFSDGEAVEVEEEPSGYLFVVHEGSLRVRKAGQPAGQLTRGCVFGGDNFLWGAQGLVSAHAEGAAGVWATSGPTFQRLLRQRVEEYAAENARFLASLASFAGLPAKQLALLANAFFEEVVEAGTVLVSKGDTTTALYFVRKGSLRVVDGSAAEGAQELGRIGPGHGFGERALLYGEPRAATVVAVEDCELLRIGAPELRAALGADLLAYLEGCLILAALRGSPTYSEFSFTQQSAIVRAMQVRDFPRDARDVIPSGGELFLLVVIAGNLVRDGVPLLSRGDYLEADGCSIVATASERLRETLRSGCSPSAAAGSGLELAAGAEGARVAVLTSGQLASAVAPHAAVQSAEQAANCAKRIFLVKKVPLFRHLSQDQTEKVLGALQFGRHAKGEYVIRQGESGDAMYMIARGEVTVLINGNAIRTQGRNGCFGERALLFDEKRTADVVVSSTEAELCSIDKATFRTMITQTMRKELMHRIALQDTQVSLEDLRHVRAIGAGAFSTVHLIEHRRSKVRYALKTVRKQKDGSAPPEMRNEIAILLENDHPFILKLVRTFELASRICMLTELVTGGDLHAAIRSIPAVLSRSQSQFYTGSLLIAIEALYDRSVLYRDLKPENVMLDDRGYVKLIDFGISKKLTENESRTFTIVGTTHYMAPEVMRGKGYGAVADLWSLGVMLFEFICGFLPFADDLDHPADVCTAVLRDPLAFPRGLRDKEGKDLIKALLCRQPDNRLGSSGPRHVKSHAYFRLSEEAPVDELFDRLMGHELEPPWLPRGERYCDPQDLSECTFSDVEELWPAGELTQVSSTRSLGSSRSHRRSGGRAAPSPKASPNLRAAAAPRSAAAAAKGRGQGGTASTVASERRWSSCWKPLACCR